jgi:hypothetical protein
MFSGLGVQAELDGFRGIWFCGIFQAAETGGLGFSISLGLRVAV